MKKLLLLSIALLTGLLFLGRLFYLQIIDDSSKLKSEINALKVVYDYPERGFVYDRNGNLMVANQVAYDVMIIPREVKPFDTLALLSMLQVDKKYVDKKFADALHWSPVRPSVLVPQLTQSEFAPLQEKLRKYPGFYIQRRTLRKYVVDHSAHALGYIREVSPETIKDDSHYQLGDLAGKSGVELQYEEELRGRKGVKRYLRDRFGRALEPYEGGRYDTIPEAGSDLTLTLDNTLQAYGQQLMANKRGGIVALEPKTGEILSLVSAPFYDPSILMGRDRSQNITKLIRDTISTPTYNRGLQAIYPPGSPFKVLNALIALQEGVITTTEGLRCNHGYSYGNRKMGCHAHATPLAMESGIAQSCNSYFAQVYRRIIEASKTPTQGLDTWNKHVTSFGLGNFLGNDLPVGQKGRVPDGAYYNMIYPNGGWYATATLSNAIGQGEVSTTPIQLANMTAAIANQGYFYTPHILKKIDGTPIKDPAYTRKRYTTIDKKHFSVVIEGMNQVYKAGTASRLQVPGIEICGKTGTAENFTKINGRTVQLTDHSVFIAFAPKDDPKIAIAVFVENGHYGATYAGKIASLMIEKYLKDEITRTDLETWILEHSLEEEYLKPLSGKPFRINRGKLVNN
jgi:penicillin-binding protein 2